MTWMKLGRRLTLVGLCLTFGLQARAEEAPRSAALAEWIAVITPRLTRALRYPPSLRTRGDGPDGVARVRFTLDRRGRASGVSIAASSGFAAFDRAAIASVTRAGRLPPPPLADGEASRVFVLPVRFIGKRAKPEPADATAAD